MAAAYSSDLKTPGLPLIPAPSAAEGKNERLRDPACPGEPSSNAPWPLDT